MTTTTDTLAGHGFIDIQAEDAGEGSDHRPGHGSTDAHMASAGSVQDIPQATDHADPMGVLPAGDKPASGRSHHADQSLSAAGAKTTDSQTPDDHQMPFAVGSDHPGDHNLDDTHLDVVAGVQTETGSAATRERVPSTVHPSLADPALALAADVLDDTERTRIANENRLRQLTRTEADSDGEERGFGLDESHPDVARLAALVDLLADVEHKATLNLQRKMREHPLGPWVKAQKGIGEKQAARLLAIIGDPYWHTAENRPRTVSELWSWCGYKTVPAGQRGDAAQRSTAGGDADSTGRDHLTADPQDPHVAARRKKGERANWSTLAKTRAFLIAESCVKQAGTAGAKDPSGSKISVRQPSPYREVYDRRKANTEGRTHAVACVRCGPSGKPAQPGSPWSDGHRHADALRITAKRILRDLWREAKRIHEAVGE